MAAPLHVIIDGFNVVFGDRNLGDLFRLSPDAAKAELIKLAQATHDGDGSLVTVVFDGKGKRLQVEHPFRDEQFTVVHAPSHISADGVIERMLSRARFPDRMTVVSNDHMIRDAAIASGAGVQSVTSWMEQTSKSARVRPSRRDEVGHGFGSRIPL